MKTCKRCGREFDRKGYFCVTCYRHHRIEQRPELAPKLKGRYSMSVKRVSPDMDGKEVYNIGKPDTLLRLGKAPSEWRGTLRMGLRIERNPKGHVCYKLMSNAIDPLPIPRVK